jgi:hypothetical protein
MFIYTSLYSIAEVKNKSILIPAKKAISKEAVNSMHFQKKNNKEGNDIREVFSFESHTGCKELRVYF